MRRFLIGWVITGFSLMFAGQTSSAHAEVPKTMAFQGRLTDQSGRPLDGNQSVIFRIYDAAGGGTKLWEETKTLAVSAGLFSALLGSTTPLALPFDRPYWVETQVGSEILNPRQPLASSPYSLRAQQVEGLSALNGNVGIGTASPGEALEVNGRVRIGAGGTSTVAALQLGGSPGVGLVNLVTNHLGLMTNGVERVRIDANGNVGIGTTEPPYQLTVDIAGNRGIAAQLFRGEYYGTLFTTKSTSPNYYVLDVRNNDTGRIGGSGTSIFTVQADGKVGIGTATPSQKLEINGAARFAPTGAPANPTPGTTYYDAATNHLLVYNGTAWKQLDN